MGGYYNEAVKSGHYNPIVDRIVSGTISRDFIDRYGMNDPVTRALLDQSSYELLTEELGRENMVQQSIILALDDNKFLPGYREIAIQPFVKGPTIDDMFSMFICVSPTLKIRHRKTAGEVLFQFNSMLARSSWLDPAPENFIFAQKKKLVYIDYQPAINQEQKDDQSGFVRDVFSRYLITDTLKFPPFPSDINSGT